MIKELNLEWEISLEDVKKIILNEKDGNKEFNLDPHPAKPERTASYAYLISIFVSRVPNIDRANEIAEIISEAWNTFPHKSLGGLSPKEVIEKHNKSN